MGKFDSILYGNGLTIHTLNTIFEVSKDPFRKYLSDKEFIYNFSHSEDHRRIVRDFEKYFKMDIEFKKLHDLSRSILKDNVDDINKYGFERWVSKNLFKEESGLKDLKIYGYILYNYWFDTINEGILKRKSNQNIIKGISQQLRDLGRDNCNFYTLNFDTIHDTILNPDHLHGRFVSPLESIESVIFHHLDSKSFEYNYLYGSNGYEKKNRIKSIKDVPDSPYDLQFFFNHDLDLGDLLIYGVGFGDTEFMNELREVKGEYKTISIVDTVDGHILEKLRLKKKNGLLKSITISYFDESDIERYRKLFTDIGLDSITNFLHCSDILNR